MCVLAEEEAGYCYHCLESGLSVTHAPNADLADMKFCILIHPYKLCDSIIHGQAKLTLWCSFVSDVCKDLGSVGYRSQL